VTLAFAEFRGRADDEAPQAERVAARYHVRHVTRVVDEAEFRSDLPRILRTMDQPSIDGINTWFVSKAAREQGLKVAMSGLGGDELFGGYPSFRDIPRWVRWLGPPARIPGLGRALRRLGGSLFASHAARLTPKALGLLEYAGSYPGAYLLRRGLFMPWELPGLLGEERAREGLHRLRPLHYIGAALDPDPGTAFCRVAVLEAALYMRNQLLRDADWAGMAHSLEIRTPLVDAEVLRLLAPALTTTRRPGGKILLGRSPSQPLLAEIVDRPKTGFQTPVRDWLERLPATGAAGGREHWARRWARWIGSEARGDKG
jgi:asparagine synthase (glutamine-hydrolysing)